MKSSFVASISNGNIYQNDFLVLKGVDLQVRRGTFNYLIGKTGSGKSSLLKVLYGDLPLEEGQGNVVGYDLPTMTWNHIPSLRRKLGIIFQDFHLLMDRTVEENLLFVLKATGWKDQVLINRRINQLLEQVGLPTKGFKMPHELSGGEQQRVVIARALLNEPELILADEPTGNLDPDTSDEVISLLKDLTERKNTAVLMATHDYSILDKFPGQIIRCQNGKIIQDLVTQPPRKV